MAQSVENINFQDIDPHDIFEEVKQDYSVLNDDTLAELEEINPEDPYSYDQRFNAAVETFFDEADFEDSFSRRVRDIDPQKVFKAIQKVRDKCLSEFACLNALIRRSTKVTGPQWISINGGAAAQWSNENFVDYFREYASSLLDVTIGV